MITLIFGINTSSISGINGAILGQTQTCLPPLKGSWNPDNWMRDSLRQESLDNAQSQLSDLQSGTPRGALNQINDGVVAAGDNIVEGAEGAAKGVWNAGSGLVNFIGAGMSGDDTEAARILDTGIGNAKQMGSAAYNTLANPSGWFQGTRDAWNAGDYGAAVGGVAPDVAAGAGLAKAGLKKIGGVLGGDGAELGEAAGLFNSPYFEGA